MKKAVVSVCMGAAALMAAAVDTTLASPQDSTSLLIRFQRISVSSFLGTKQTQDSFIFRDGLVIEILTGDFQPCELVRMSGTPAAVVGLKRTLAENRVGVQEGNCAIDEGIDNFSFENQLTWFGKNARQHSYKTGNQLPEVCPVSTLEIDNAVRLLLATATNRQSAHTCP